MQSLWKRTQTGVHSRRQQERQKQEGWQAGERAMGAVQLGTQLLLWIFFFGYDLCAQTVWQAALMLSVPLLALWLCWQKAVPDLPSAKWLFLLLLPCLWVDAVFLVFSLGGFISQLVPNDPPWVTTLLPAAFCFLTAWCARPRGVQYGVRLLIAPLIALLVLGTVFLRASTRADRLWPILGNGLLSTAGSALTGTGALWGSALLFAVSQKEIKTGKTAWWTFLPWLLCVLCALWFGFLKPWLPGDELAVAEKMMGLARHAHSVILYEMSGVLWMLLIPAALISCYCTGGILLRRAFPQLPVWLSVVLLPVFSIALVLWKPENVFAMLKMLLPWRYVPAIACAFALCRPKRRAR